MLHEQTIRPDAFDEWITQPENAHRQVELIDGRMIDVPSNAYVSAIALQIAYLLKSFLARTGLAGHVTGEGGGYQVGDERYAPDVAYLSKTKQAQLARQGFNPIPPELAVEVVSPTDSASHLWIKVRNYLAHQVVVWVVHPDIQEVVVYLPDGTTTVLTVSDTIDGVDVLPGFSVSVADFFDV